MPTPIEKFREMGQEELRAQHHELSEELFRLRFQIAAGQMEGLKRYREARRDLARVNTLLGGIAGTAKKETHGS